MTGGVTTAALISYYRTVAIPGRMVDLVPYAAEHHQHVVELRNLPAVRQFMNLDSDATLSTQQRWYGSYQKRSDDLYWVIVAKSRQVVGTNRIYDITGDQLEKGSLIIDPDAARLGPFALEAELLLIRFVFDVLTIPRIITAIATDNVKMLSINARFGFKPVGQRVVRGKEFLVFELRRYDFNPRPLESVVDHWSKRHER